MNEFAKIALHAAKQIQEDVYDVSKPPAEGGKPKTNQVIDFTLIRGTRGYLERVVNQINGAYENGWYDACAVMLRRLIETLIIEVFEEKGIANNIIDGNGNYLYLRDLIDKTVKEKSFKLGRTAESALPKLKDIGDKSAHSRRYNAYRKDIEKLLPEIRDVIQELTSLAGLK